MVIEDQEKTSFITPFGAFCYTSVPFGLKNARATYQRTMQNCLKEKIGRNVHAYVDDIVIKSQLVGSLINNLQETFKNLRTYQMKLNPAKCTFGVLAVKLLGYIISKRGIEVNPEKLMLSCLFRSQFMSNEFSDSRGVSKQLRTSHQWAMPKT